MAIVARLPTADQINGTTTTMDLVVADTVVVEGVVAVREGEVLTVEGVAEAVDGILAPIRTINLSMTMDMKEDSMRSRDQV